ncbi:glycosyl transferase [Pseudomonas sp. MPR-ANC1]|uniref:MraY family glycosyltransferase n=1 Tax=Pseudomonas sp. MPR-ANC1 TaxID=2075548 RepID=UPI000CD1664F|nr:glycosyltransferase family 4 protein [Pseudomonas sp. MPR-ANC1]POA46186.1 glycosyl transferase [Pseudomonas sp. MPR-ANC1]
MTVWWLLFAVFAISWASTFVLRRYALTKSLMDIPNERSSHSVPTPRGGGVAIVVSFLLALPVLAGLNLISASTLYGVFGSGLLVALIGFADDHGHIAARWRLLGHFIAAGWALFWFNGFPTIDLFGVVINLGWFGDILGVVYLVWMLNLYNFMDGIDGLASAEAISVCLGMGLVCWISGSSDLAWMPLILAGAVAGFLWWNFPPARIFMGDAGSGFLGLVLGGLAIQSSGNSPEMLWSWMIMLSVFIVDATWTLIQRLLRGDKVYEAHRSHGYQHATDRWGSHGLVTAGVVIINVCYLFPLALMVGNSWLNGAFGALLAYSPLMVLAWKFNAGVAASK